jgi:hypothetical protein
LRIVSQHRAHACEHRTAGRAQSLHIRTRRLPSDPATFSARKCGPTIEARADFHSHARHTRSHALFETRIELARVAFHQSNCHLNAGSA